MTEEKTVKKTTRQLERHFKGVANHRRIEILLLVAKNGPITLEGIASSLRCNLKTISDHTQRLARAGLINKKYQGRRVEHTVSPYGELFLDFIEKFRKL